MVILRTVQDDSQKQSLDVFFLYILTLTVSPISLLICWEIASPQAGYLKSLSFTSFSFSFHSYPVSFLVIPPLPGLLLHLIFSSPLSQLWFRPWLPWYKCNHFLVGLPTAGLSKTWTDSVSGCPSWYQLLLCSQNFNDSPLLSGLAYQTFTKWPCSLVPAPKSLLLSHLLHPHPSSSFLLHFSRTQTLHHANIKTFGVYQSRIRHL